MKNRGLIGGDLPRTYSRQCELSSSFISLPSPKTTKLTTCQQPPTTSTSNFPSFTRSVLEPLTTTFTPPSDCTQCYEVTSGNQIHGNTCRAYAEDCLGIPRASFLPEVSNYIFNIGSPWGFFSPGIVCPIGWTTAGPTISYGQTERDGGVGNVVDFLEEGEMVGLCCPR